MIVPVLLLVLSLCGLAFALIVPGMSDLLLLAAPSSLAALWLILQAWPRRDDTPQRPLVVIDGSNVMHWWDQVPKLSPVRDVVRRLEAMGYTPGIVFDANAGHRLIGRYQHDHDFAKLLGLPTSRVLVVDKGTPADPKILAAARDMNASVISNDQFRDWAQRFPEVQQPGFLVRGGYRDGRLWLDLDEAAEAARSA
jgi:hypothetical protein